MVARFLRIGRILRVNPPARLAGGAAGRDVTWRKNYVYFGRLRRWDPVNLVTALRKTAETEAQTSGSR